MYHDPDAPTGWAAIWGMISFALFFILIFTLIAVSG